MIMSIASKNKGITVIDNKTPNYYDNTYDPWTTKQQLVIWKEVKGNLSWWWTPYLWNFIITWTWNISITWLWFKPSLVRFDVCDQASWSWTWVMTQNSQYALNYSVFTQITWQCIYYWSPVKARAVYVSMDNDWFTINCTYFTANTYVNYTAYR